MVEFSNQKFKSLLLPIKSSWSELTKITSAFFYGTGYWIFENKKTSQLVFIAPHYNERMHGVQNFTLDQFKLLLRLNHPCVEQFQAYYKLNEEDKTCKAIKSICIDQPLPEYIKYWRN